MNIKPKEIAVNLPIVLTFDEHDKIFEFAANINTLIHGKVKVKCEHLGVLGAKQIGIFYLQRNGEYQSLRDSFVELIETEEMNTPQPYPHKDPKTMEEWADNDLFRHLENAADLTPPAQVESACGWCHDPDCKDES